MRGKFVVGIVSFLSLLGIGTASAGAAVYCVDQTVTAGCDVVEGGSGAPGLTAALVAANGNPDADTIRLGNAQYNAPIQTGFVATQPVTIVGSGQGPGHTVIQMFGALAQPAGFTSFYGLTLQAGGGASDLRLKMPPQFTTGANQSYYGIFSTVSAEVSRVTVTADGEATDTGVVLLGGGSLSDSTVDLTNSSFGGHGVGVSGGAVVDRTTVKATSGIDMGTGTVRRSNVYGSSQALGVGGGTGEVDDTVLSTPGTGFGAFVYGGGTMTLDGVTVAHDPAFTAGTGVYAVNTNLNETDTAILRNTVIDTHFDTAIDRRATDTGAVSNVTTSYSNYDRSTVIDTNSSGGTGSIADSNLTQFGDPGFTDAAAGDYNLLASSPLIDVGDPAAPAAGRLDLGGNPRAILGKPGCTPRRDIGAYEFAPSPAIPPSGCPVPPGPSITGRRAAALKKCKKKHGKKRKKCRRRAKKLPV
jgi:hypothetical protein